MGMLEKKPTQKTGKSLLRHTPGGVEVENQVDRESIIQSVKETAAPKKKPAEKTTSIRISVTTRNALNSLVTLGEADTVNTLLDQLITQKLESLRPDQQRTYDIINGVATKRDKD
ncbi:DUF5388 domain-containing protein [Lacticaseibacillus suilingensis]|uniref:DUF5388 domain-containing protein n=1 Tax=Lacticaseibacillus suilingensis TaxID=2799577 RepID=A0ABW4BCI5_9LACO|nr:DUF5388 domain-containing protein [Lacticaseibacillus suilingensis]